MKHEFSGHIFEKNSNIKFDQNPSSGSRVVPYGRTVGHDKLTVAFRSGSRTVGVSSNTLAEGLAFLKQTKELRLAGAIKM